MKKLGKEALKNKRLAAVIIGQAILDEGYIGTDRATIRYNSNGIAKYIFRIADRWGWATSFQKHAYVDNREPDKKKICWRFNLRREAVIEIAEIAGEFPDKEKEEGVKLLLKIGKKGVNKGIKKEEVFREIEKGSKTVVELARKFGVTRNSIVYHLEKLEKENKIIKTRAHSYGRYLYSDPAVEIANDAGLNLTD
jgi:DNA-binding transcriptional ArsR family regulator